jgi:beta-glucosidase
VREEPISGNVVDGVKENRSYLGQKATVVNPDELTLIKGSVALMQDRPVVVCVNATKPMVFSEFESEVAGILMGFGTKGTEFLNIPAGHAEPSGLLPLQMPASMDAVEAQLEDVPRDMDCRVDSEGNEYDFAYGLNWSGTIDDERTKTYKADSLTASEYLKL